MKKLAFLAFVLIALYVLSANKEKEPKSHNNLYKKHVVFVLDSSKSTIDWPTPTIDFFTPFVEKIKIEGGTIEVYNCSDRVAIPVKLKLNQVPSEPKIQMGEIAFKKAQKLRKKVQSQNEIRIKTFYAKIEALSLREKSNWTYVNSTLKQVKRSLASPIYENGYESFCLILSDLQNSVPKQKTTPVDRDILSNITAYSNVYLSNYDDSDLDYSELGVIEIEYTDFIDILNNY